MSDKNKYAGPSLDDLIESPLSKYFREQRNQTQAFNVESPALKALREQREMLGHITSMKPDFIKALEKQQEDFAHLINTEPTIIKAVRAQQEILGHNHIASIKPDFIKAIVKQQKDFARLTDTAPIIPRELCAQNKIMNRIIDLNPSSSLDVLNKQQEMLSCHLLFRSLESIKNEDLELKVQANQTTCQIANFFSNSEEKQMLEESLSVPSLTPWLSAVFIVHYTVRGMTISSVDIDDSFRPLMQENIDNIQSLISVTTSSTMFHFLISLRRNHRLGELLAQ